MLSTQVYKFLDGKLLIDFSIYNTFSRKPAGMRRRIGFSPHPTGSSLWELQKRGAKMKFTQGKVEGSAPSSSLGIMRFFDQDTGGPKLTPEFVLGFAIVVSAVMIIVQFYV
jgi:preprotein translocase subunit Sec61beta